MKIKLAILESDQNYLNRIVTAFTNKFADKLEVYSFSDAEVAFSTIHEARLHDLTVTLYDSAGKAIGQSPVEVSGEALIEQLDRDGGKVSFQIPGGMDQQVEITCTDQAGNVYVSRFDKITVSTQWYVIFYANKPLFILAVLSLALLVAGLTAFLILRRKKKATA